jgi:hypothetical protein
MFAILFSLDDNPFPHKVAETSFLSFQHCQTFGFHRETHLYYELASLLIFSDGNSKLKITTL